MKFLEWYWVLYLRLVFTSSSLLFLCIFLKIQEKFLSNFIVFYFLEFYGVLQNKSILSPFQKISVPLPSPSDQNCQLGPHLNTSLQDSQS